jgi:hypothetical protein
MGEKGLGLAKAKDEFSIQLSGGRCYIQVDFGCKMDFEIEVAVLGRNGG